MQTIPDQIKKMVNSPEIYTAVEKIGNKFNLHIDQLGELDAAIRSILLGISESSDFQKKLSEKLEIDEDQARQITEEVNKEIFEAIKGKLQSDTQIEKNVSAIEQAGDFEILENNEEAGVGATVSTIQGPAGMKMTVDSVHTDIIADHLLNNPVAVKREKIVVKAPEKFGDTVPENLPTEENGSGTGTKEQVRQEQKERYASDPYREPIK